MYTNKIGIINNKKLPLSLSGRAWGDGLRVALAEGRPLEVYSTLLGTRVLFLDFFNLRAHALMLTFRFNCLPGIFTIPLNFNL